MPCMVHGRTNLLHSLACTTSRNCTLLVPHWHSQAWCCMVRHISTRSLLQVALGGMKYSEDGALLAYQLSSGGSDWRTMHVLKIDAASGQPTKLDDELRHVKFSDIAWTHDGKASR